MALEDPAPLLPHAAGKWISSLREFLRLANGSIRIQDLQGVKIKRKHDVIIMDECLRREFSTTETRRINNVRMYLRVETLSDICNASGTHIHESVFRKTDKTILPPNLNFKKGMSTTTSLWPRQAKPGPKSFEVWNRFLRQFHTSNSPKLCKPLGEWISQDAAKERIWPHAFDPDTDMIFDRLSDGKCAFYESYERKRRNLQVTGDIIFDDEPRTSIPVDRLKNRMHSPYSDVRLHSDEDKVET